MTTRVLVCGGRDFNDYDLLESVLDTISSEVGVFQIISGCAKGADTLAIQYANKHEYPLREFPADWDKHGKAAGPIRNKQMLDEGRPNIVIAFPGGRGTADMVNRSKKVGIEVIEISE